VPYALPAALRRAWPRVSGVQPFSSPQAFSGRLARAFSCPPFFRTLISGAPAWISGQRLLSLLRRRFFSVLHFSLRVSSSL